MSNSCLFHIFEEKRICMRKKILYAAAFIFLSWAASSCEGENCKFCREVTVDNLTGERIEGFETEYCGAALFAIMAKTPITVGNRTTSWECR
jgi:hypothetical protein